jgi:hypothetical protein
LVEPLELAPGLLASPTLHPCLDLVPAPHSAAGVFGERSGEALPLGDLMGALLADAEKFGDLDESDWLSLGHRIN